MGSVQTNSLSFTLWPPIPVNQVNSAGKPTRHMKMIPLWNGPVTPMQTNRLRSQKLLRVMQLPSTEKTVIPHQKKIQTTQRLAMIQTVLQEAVTGSPSHLQL